MDTFRHGVRKSSPSAPIAAQPTLPGSRAVNGAEACTVPRLRLLEVVAAGLLAFGLVPVSVAGQHPEPAGRGAAAHAPDRSGRIAGTVTDVHGHPLDGAMVSAFGPLGAELVVSDGDGRFVLPSLAPGRYLVQAHVAGFATSRREFVLVTAGPAGGPCDRGEPRLSVVGAGAAGRGGPRPLSPRGRGAGPRFGSRGPPPRANRTGRTITPRSRGACAGPGAASSSRRNGRSASAPPPTRR